MSLFCSIYHFQGAPGAPAPEYMARPAPVFVQRPGPTDDEVRKICEAVLKGAILKKL